MDYLPSPTLFVPIPSQDMDFQSADVMVFFMFNELKWDIVVCFVDIGWILVYHSLNFLFIICSWRGVLNTTLCDEVSQWLAAGQLFSPGTTVTSINKTDDITEILLKVALKHHKPQPHILLILSIGDDSQGLYHRGSWCIPKVKDKEFPLVRL